MKLAKNPMPWDKLLLLIIIVMSSFSVLTVVTVDAFFDPKLQAESSLKKIADEYYVNYLYPRLLGNSSNPADALATYVSSGVPTTYLRQLLLYDNAKHNNVAGDFSNSYYKCDTNRTGVRYFPEEPFGPHDYRMDVYWECQKL